MGQKSDRRVRRGRALLVAAAVVPSALIFQFLPGERPAHAQTRRPNVLIVVTDDQRVDTDEAIPNTLVWLQRNGVTFENAFATTPVCCPARSSIFTGRYVHNHGVLHNSDAGELDHRSTLQRYLQGVGYRTGTFGKFLNSWKVRLNPPYFHRWGITPRSTKYYNAPVNLDGRVRNVPSYFTTFISNQAVSFLKGAEREDGRPWFLYLAPVAPHGPFTPEPKYRLWPFSHWDGNPAVFEDNPSVDPEGRSDKPEDVREAGFTFEKAQNVRRQQLRSTKSVDDMMGRLRGTLARLGEIRNTLVIFISDNGFLWAEHGLNGKSQPYDPSVRVPFFMSWPARGLSGSDARLVANIDIVPTVLDAAGVSPDPRFPVDGKSLLDKSSEREELLFELWARDRENRSVPSWASLRSSSYVYTEYYNELGLITFREYYDLTEDPWELRNLFGDLDPSNDPLDFLGLSLRLAGYRGCSGGECP